jgi:hypothetical protein
LKTARAGELGRIGGEKMWREEGIDGRAIHAVFVAIVPVGPITTVLVPSPCMPANPPVPWLILRGPIVNVELPDRSKVTLNMPEPIT